MYAFLVVAPWVAATSATPCCAWCFASSYAPVGFQCRLGYNPCPWRRPSSLPHSRRDYNFVLCAGFISFHRVGSAARDDVAISSVARRDASFSLIVRS